MFLIFCQINEYRVSCSLTAQTNEKKRSYLISLSGNIYKIHNLNKHVEFQCSSSLPPFTVLLPFIYRIRTVWNMYAPFECYLRIRIFWWFLLSVIRYPCTAIWKNLWHLFNQTNYCTCKSYQDLTKIIFFRSCGWQYPAKSM